MSQGRHDFVGGLGADCGQDNDELVMIEKKSLIARLLPWASHTHRLTDNQLALRTFR
ncbi:hypothetical protein [Serratia sp. DD3]|uniref:hypothetical protein n=1 Tax=Serratia sp. DD3 TaxID=1410619 RepID=UPI0004140C78|nr:hypothetical protein [Serratia sp. DD3]